MGGSVNLFTDPDWGQGFSGRTFTEYGSYDTWTAGGQLNHSRGRSSFKTRAYYQHSQNDYEYINRILTNTPFRERRTDADYSQWSVMQEAYFRLSPYARLTAVGWLQGGTRMLPQPLGVVQTSHERQQDLNGRAYAGLDWSRGIHQLHLKAAWLYSDRTTTSASDRGSLRTPRAPSTSRRRGRRWRTTPVHPPTDWCSTPPSPIPMTA